MNERIKELYDQATEYYSNGYVDCPELNEEKFAELIVKECSQFTDPITRKLMMKHFGIK